MQYKPISLTVRGQGQLTIKDGKIEASEGTRFYVRTGRGGELELQCRGNKSTCITTDPRGNTVITGGTFSFGNFVFNGGQLVVGNADFTVHDDDDGHDWLERLDDVDFSIMSTISLLDTVVLNMESEELKKLSRLELSGCSTYGHMPKFYQDLTLAVSGTASVKIWGRMEKDVVAYVSGCGSLSVYGKINGDATLNISGTASAKLPGSVRHLGVNASGCSCVKPSTIVRESVDIQASGTAKVKVNTSMYKAELTRKSQSGLAKIAIV